jgi:hypothetical protein
MALIQKYKDLPLGVQAHLDTLISFISDVEDSGGDTEDAAASVNLLIDHLRGTYKEN